VLEDITLQRLDATALSAIPPGGPGIVIANLPYGQRTGDRVELEPLYRGFFSSLRKVCPGWTVAAYVEDVKLLERSLGGIPLSNRYEVGNGGLHCTLGVGTLPLFG
jgi:putative N6-adenine-specific DNA methylase